MDKDNTGKFFASDNPEHYSVGPFDTREEAIEEFRSDNDGQAPSFIGRGREVYCYIDGMSIVEDLANGSLYEELYEDALSDWCRIKRGDPRWDALSERLTEVFHKWLDEVGEPKSWTLIEQEDTAPARAQE